MQYASDSIEFICNEAGIASETINAQIKAAIYEAKSKGKSEKKEKKGKKGESTSSGKNKHGNDKVTGQSQMQKKWKKDKHLERLIE